MNGRTSGYLEVNGGNLYYETAGVGETLVLCHAGFVDSRMWDAQWEAFAQRFRVIRYDMLGFGRSDKATGPVSRREELQGVLEGLGVKRAVLLGCSMGGGTALDFTLERPEQVMALIIVSATPSGFEMQGEPPPLLMEMISAFQSGDERRASELQIRIWVDGIFREPDEVDPAVRRQAAEMNRIPVVNGTAMVADMEPMNPLQPPAVQRLDELEVPTLIMVGGLDHPEILRAASFMEEQIEGAYRVTLGNSAHVPNMEEPEAFNSAVLEFLRKVYESVPTED